MNLRPPKTAPLDGFDRQGKSGHWKIIGTRTLHVMFPIPVSPYATRRQPPSPKLPHPKQERNENEKSPIVDENEEKKLFCLWVGYVFESDFLPNWKNSFLRHTHGKQLTQQWPQQRQLIQTRGSD